MRLKILEFDAREPEIIEASVPEETAPFVSSADKPETQYPSTDAKIDEQEPTGFWTSVWKWFCNLFDLVNRVTVLRLEVGYDSSATNGR